MRGDTWNKIDRMVRLARKVRHWKRCPIGGCPSCYTNGEHHSVLEGDIEKRLADFVIAMFGNLSQEGRGVVARRRRKAAKP